MKGLYGLILILSSVIYSRSQSQCSAVHGFATKDAAAIFFLDYLSTYRLFTFALLLNFGFKWWFKTSPDEAKSLGQMLSLLD